MENKFLQLHLASNRLWQALIGTTGAEDREKKSSKQRHMPWIMLCGYPSLDRVGKSVFQLIRIWSNFLLHFHYLEMLSFCAFKIWRFHLPFCPFFGGQKKKDSWEKMLHHVHGGHWALIWTLESICSYALFIFSFAFKCWLFGVSKFNSRNL